MSFPKHFVWGAAAAAYQIEGAAKEDGKGPSVWDAFCRKPGAIKNGHTGDIACDHYHRYRDDVALMKGLGLHAYRLSVSWPRVLPRGRGAVNPKGLAFYDRLLDALLEAGIEPYVTLFHWDYPLALYKRGGWLNPAASDWFAEYAGVMVRRLGDRVRIWMTLNEPQVFMILGHADGQHAPGDTWNFKTLLKGVHHMLLAHGKAVQAIRAATPKPARVGLAAFGSTFYPASESQADVAAARTAMFSVTAKQLWGNAWWLEPIFKGRYPEDGLKVFGRDVPKIGKNDLATICQPLDFFGVNIYQGTPVRQGKNGKPELLKHPVGKPVTAFKWPVTPEALYWGPRFYWERYQLPIFITESGMSSPDWVQLDGQVHDSLRIDYLKRYLRELRRAYDEGIGVAGYFQWSILDNFEWAEGYQERFGLVYVDYPTQQRIPKDSAAWYRDVIASNGETLG
ncbi:MAG: beta-glucosidase [Lentisphaerae bacterium]|nr:beta-glucosidase [Lentisphaerota bacterium]